MPLRWPAGRTPLAPLASPFLLRPPPRPQNRSLRLTLLSLNSRKRRRKSWTHCSSAKIQRSARRSPRLCATCVRRIIWSPGSFGLGCGGTVVAEVRERRCHSGRLRSSRSLLPKISAANRSLPTSLLRAASNIAATARRGGPGAQSDTVSHTLVPLLPRCSPLRPGLGQRNLFRQGTVPTGEGGGGRWRRAAWGTHAF
jgi:hypothetical protein